jgi:hypothetical protein
MTMTTFQACAIVEGTCCQDHSWQEELSAWAALISTGACWGLQGWYGRNASDLILSGLISETGVVDWDRAEELVSA